MKCVQCLRACVSSLWEEGGGGVQESGCVSVQSIYVQELKAF